MVLTMEVTEKDTILDATRTTSLLAPHSFIGVGGRKPRPLLQKVRCRSLDTATTLHKRTILVTTRVARPLEDIRSLSLG